MSVSKEKFSEIVLAINDLDKDQFKTVKSLLKKRANEFKEKSIKKWKNELEKGKKYELTDGTVAEVIEVKRTRFKGYIEGSRYNIPISMVVKEVK